MPVFLALAGSLFLATRGRGEGEAKGIGAVMPEDLATPEQDKPPGKAASNGPPDAQAPRPVSQGRYMAKIPKVWARLVSVNAETGEVVFVPDGKSESTRLRLNDDAQIHARGFFGALADFVPGEHLWVWLDFNQQDEWTGIRVLADELSARRLHGKGSVVKEIDRAAGRVTVAPPRGEARALRVVAGTRVCRGEEEGGLDLLAPGMEVVYQQVWADGDYRASLIVDAAGLERLREASRRRAEERWLRDGFRGDITWKHPPQGEARVLLEAAATRWARALDQGARVSVRAAAKPEAAIDAAVVRIVPLYEKTELYLVIEGVEQAALGLGDAVRVHLERPSLPEGEVPPDLGRFGDRQARLDWFLSSVYCTCGNSGEVCAGHFYTLAACNHMRCNMPAETVKEVGGMIDAGRSDAEILERLLKERGPLLLRQHILP